MKTTYNVRFIESGRLLKVKKSLSDILFEYLVMSAIALMLIGFVLWYFGVIQP